MESANISIQIKQLNVQDIKIAQQLFFLFSEVFENESPSISSESHIRKLLLNPGFIVYAAIHENEIIGGLTAYELQMYHSDSAEIFIYDIAVTQKYQRRGVGKKLLESIQEYCRKNGITEMFVSANEEDQHALDFYQATGGMAEKVFNFTYNIN